MTRSRVQGLLAGRSAYLAQATEEETMRFARSTALLCALAVAAAAGAAAARGDGGPGPPPRSDAAFAPGFRYATDPTGRSTHVMRFDARGRVAVKRLVGGNWGIPTVSYDGTAGGLSHDRSTLVLTSGPASPSRFAVFDARTLRMKQVVSLPGSWSFDALSPGARTLYLIQYVVSRYATRYYVRAFDLRLHRLLKKIVFDTREKWGLMSGSPVTRATGPNGRWVYTLYTRPGGKPFVHALDSSYRRAVCVDLPWVGSQASLMGMKLTLRGHKLRLRRADGAVVKTVDTRTYVVT